MSLLSLKQIKKQNGNTSVFPLFDLHIQPGTVTAIQCHNETGHQLLETIIGREPLSSGSITFSGEVIQSGDKDLFRQLSVVFLKDALYERLSPIEYLSFFKKLYEVDTNIEELLHMFRLYDKKHIHIKRLSFSEKKRLLIARAIVFQPQLLLLEEIDQNIDIESKIIIQQALYDTAVKGTAILMTTSNLENAIMLAQFVYRLTDQGLKQLETEEPIQADETTENFQMEETASKEDSTEHSQIRLNKIPAKVNDKLILFDPMEIDFIESNDGISHLHVKGEIFPCTFTLNELDERLQAFGFFRCHRSYIVNLQKVREVITWTRNSYSLVLDDLPKSSIPLSKGKLNELKEIIGL